MFTITDLIAQLEQMRDGAQFRANQIIDNGEEVDEITRAKSQATADAYAFVLHQLRTIKRGKQ